MKPLIMLKRQDLYGPGFELFYGEKDFEGELSIAKPMVLESIPEGSSISHSPLMILDEDSCTTLMNELWVAGIRPTKRLSDPEGSAHIKEEVSWLRGTIDHILKVKR